MSDYTPKVGDVIDVAATGTIYQTSGSTVYFLTPAGAYMAIRSDSDVTITKRSPEVQPGDVWLDGDGDTWIVGDDMRLRILGYSNTRLARNGEQWSDVDAAYDGLTLAVRDGKAVPA